MIIEKDKGVMQYNLQNLIEENLKLKNENEELKLSYEAELKRLKEREEKQRKKEDLYKEAQQIARIGNWELDLNTYNLYWSEGIYQIFEIDQEKFGATYEAFLAAIHPDDLERVNNAYTESVKNRKPYEIAHRLLMKDGRIKWLNERCRTYYDTNGKPIKSVGIVQDITALKLVEESNRKIEYKLRQIIDLVPHFIFAKDEDGRFLLANQSLAEAYGTEIQNLIGKKDIDFNPNIQEVESFRKDDKYVIENKSKKSNIIESITNNKGNKQILQTTKIPFSFYGKEIDSVLGVCVDISNTKLAEENLKRSEENLRKIIDLIPHLIYVKDKNSNLILGNKAYADYYAKSIDELIGKNYTSIIPNKSEIKKIKEIDRYILDNNIAQKDIVHTLTDINGKLRTFNTSKIPTKLAGSDDLYIIGVSIDITNQINAEEKLRKSQENLRQVIDLVPHYIFSKDINGKYLMANKALAEVYNTSVENLIGKTDSDFNTNKEEVEKYKIDDRYVIESKQSKSNIIQTLTDYQGNTRTLRTTKIPYNIANSEIQAVLGISLDVTETVLAEEKLRKSEEFNRSIIETANEGITVWDKNDVVIYVNSRMSEIVDYSKEEMLGKIELDYIFDEDKVEMKRRSEERRKGLSEHFELKLKRKDKKDCWVLVSCSPIFDKDSSYAGHFAMFTDISKKKKAMIESMLFHKAVESCKDAIFITDTEGIIKYINPGFTKLYGYSQNEVVNKTTPRIVKSGKMNSDFYENFWSKLLNKEFSNHEIVNKSKDGKLIYIQESTDQILNEKNELIGYIAIQYDISERIKHDEKIRELYNELSISQRELQKSLQVKNSFFSIIAHDLRGPFSGFLGLTDLLAKSASDLTYAEIKRMSEGINRSANAVFKLINDLLEWSQIQTGSFHFKKEKLDLFEVSNETILILKAMSENKEIELSLEIPKYIQINFDKNMLTSVIPNLVSNAIKFTKRGGKITVGITNDSENGLIPNDQICIYVQDNGIGMPKHIKEALFELEVKTTRSGTEKEASTGLGLILCKEFVEINGGKIWVESQEAVGTTFYFTASLL